MLKENWRSIVYTLSLVLLVFLEFYALYLVSPSEGSQQMVDSADTAHFLYSNMMYIRGGLLAILVFMASGIFRKLKRYPKVLVTLGFLMYLGLFFMANFQLRADKMFLGQSSVQFLKPSDSVVPLDTEVLGVSIGNESKAYPLEYLAYHHKVSDQIGDASILATYCIWCRSGRVFNTKIDGKTENFRLVGMTQYNAVIEDESSESWWQQATGRAIAGKRKGQQLDEIPTSQMKLEDWIVKHPETLILQPDTSFAKQYAHYGRFVSRFGVDSTEYSSWKKRSWIIGIETNNEAAAFDFVSLIDERVLQEQVGGTPVVVTIQSDSTSFHAFSAAIDTLTLSFEFDNVSETLKDLETETSWNLAGEGISGVYAGRKLQPIQSYEEYWYSWKTFHPDTKKVGGLEERTE
ncbi:MAG: DUF3179 domain-containing (seleno)protein [Saprospiraceae bacterium]|nr:DUF3179 domain-containing (seleno)protein [Saprospiraceae bacterium]